MTNKIQSQAIPTDHIICSDSAWPKGNAKNLSTQISLWWANHLIKSVDRTKYWFPPPPDTAHSVFRNKPLYPLLTP